LARTFALTLEIWRPTCWEGTLWSNEDTGHPGTLAVT